MILDRLESEILRLHNGFTLRPSLDTIIAIGERLDEAKRLLPHGEWLPWLKRIGIPTRTAQLYLQCARADPPDGNISMRQFLRIMRQAKRQLGKARMEEQRQAALERNVPRHPEYKVITADCRKYKWQPNLDVICTDPPWSDIEAYKWLGSFAKKHLKPSGLLIVACSQFHLPAQMMALARLDYAWTLAIVFSQLQESYGKVVQGYNPSWRPVCVYSDTYTVPPLPRLWHQWEQPLKPYAYWLERLTLPGLPGETVADPFAGSATVGVALKQLGHRSYIGTEINPQHAKVARARLAQA